MSESATAVRELASPRRGPWLGILLFVLGIVAGTLLERFEERHVGKVNLDTVGNDISHSGGTKLLVVGTDGFLRQTCSGVCDDLSYGFKNRSAEYTIKVENDAGVCLLCPGTYTDSYSTNREKISGSAKLGLNAVDPIVGEVANPASASQAKP